MTDERPDPPLGGDPTDPPLSPEGQRTVASVRRALEEALAHLESEEQAEAIIDQVLATLAAMGPETVEDIRKEEGPASRPEAREAVSQAADAAPEERLGSTLIEAARQIARSEGETRKAIEQGAQQAANPELYGEENPETRQPRDWLLRALIRRMGPTQRLDTRLFLLINGLPHPPAANRAMYGLTTVMNAGGGWVLFLLGAALVDPRRGVRALHSVLPPLWLATMTVEFPIKRYFRRKRPFIDVVQAVAVGRKPLGYSFPSGHSAAAFAGAVLLCRHYPRLAPLWLLIASLVGFSRVYLGAHYPGDVLIGALTGIGIAETTRWSIEQAYRREGAGTPA